MVDKKEDMMQSWMQKIVETEERKKIIPHQPFCISKSNTCPICYKSFEKEEIGDLALTEKYSLFSYEEWMQKLDETGDECPFCGKTFDFLYTCMFCNKKIKTNTERKDTGGLNVIICNSEECKKTILLEYKKSRCPLCNHTNIFSLSEDFSLFQIYEENSADYWKNENEKADVYCPLCGSLYLIKHCIICGCKIRTFFIRQILCGSDICTKIRLLRLKEKRRLEKLKV